MTTRLDIISDPVCPWCYLGAASLMRALGEHGGPHPLALHWRPYQLDPSLPPEGIDRAAYLAGHFPDPGGLEAAHRRLAAMGAEASSARETGVTGVPTCILAGRYAISGAQPFGFWSDLIARIDAAGPPSPSVS